MFYYIDRPIHSVSYLERFAKAFTQRQINTVSTHLEAHVNVHNAHITAAVPYACETFDNPSILGQSGPNKDGQYPSLPQRQVLEQAAEPHSCDANRRSGRLGGPGPGQAIRKDLSSE